MKPLYTLLGRVGSEMSLISILVLILVLNVSWTLTLELFGQHFSRVAGLPLLDLQNVRGVLDVQQATTLISGYSTEAKSLYWSFFIMDNLMPPLVFGSFALLWAKLFSHSTAALPKRLLNSPILLIPLGVGVFDWFENLAFITALSTMPAPGAEQAMQIGLILVQLKALCLFSTFGLTIVFIVYSAILWVTQVLRGRLLQPA